MKDLRQLFLPQMPKNLDLQKYSGLIFTIIIHALLFLKYLVFPTYAWRQDDVMTNMGTHSDEYYRQELGWSIGLDLFEFFG